MKVIIAGGRDYVFTTLDFEMLDRFHAVLKFSVVVSGGAGKRDKDTGRVLAGADLFGEVWAARQLLTVAPFYISKAEWNEYGPSAGPRRNQRMAEHVARAGGCAILFPGGRGTRSMRTEAWGASIPFLERDAFPQQDMWFWICSERANLKRVAPSVPMRIELPSGDPDRHDHAYIKMR